MFSKICALSGVASGDLIFFERSQSESSGLDEAVLAVCAAANDVFHAGLFCRGGTAIVHALPNVGVIVESIDEAVKRVEATRVEVFSVNAKGAVREAAANWAVGEVGCGYNDLFSLECLNSEGKKSYYCCQLVVKAYENSGLPGLCPPHKLNFLNAKGEFHPHWVEYYEQRHYPIPQGEPGSHPGKLITSSHLRARLKTVDPMGKFSISRTVDSALHFLAGCRISVRSARSFDVLQPRSVADANLVNAAVSDAKRSQPKWMNAGAQQRAAVLRKAAAIIRESVEDLAYMESLDCGKPICESRVDMAACADCFEFFAGVAHNLAGSHFPLSDGQYAYTERVPWGIVGAIGVWNYPMQTASWKIAPALICGNAVVYKPSELAPVTSVLLAEILHHAGLPSGVLSVLQGDGTVGQAICEHPDINKVTFTGSSATGANVYSSCSKEGNLKPVTLELGGKSACIMCEDADLDVAVTGALLANYFSQGEVCTNASKILVHDSIYKEFRERVVDATRKIVVGDPLKEDTRCGATISRDHLLKVKGFIDEAVEEGGKLLCGGEQAKIDGLPDGSYLTPAIIENVNKNMRIYREEVFGSVMLLIPYSFLEDAIRMANDTPFGLANGVFTKNLTTAYSVASQLHAGTVYVNTFNDSNAMVPFGGMKQSGFGRENGTAALDAFSQVKSVFVNPSSRLANPFL